MYLRADIRHDVPSTSSSHPCFASITCYRQDGGNELFLLRPGSSQYANAHAWYKNLDKLIHYANKDGRLNVFYSSPQGYVKAKHAYKKVAIRKASAALTSHLQRSNGVCISLQLYLKVLRTRQLQSLQRFACRPSFQMFLA